MEASANFADASILMRKIGFVVVLLRGYLWCPLTGVTLQVSEPPADIASAVSAGDFFLSHAPLAVD